MFPQTKRMTSNARKPLIIGGIITLLCLIGIIIFSTQNHQLMNQFSKISSFALSALILLHILYVIVNAELWRVALRAADNNSSRREIYLSSFLGAGLASFSAPIGLAIQAATFSKISKQSGFANTAGTMATTIWIRAAVGSIAVTVAAIFSGLSLSISIGAVLVLASVFMIMVWLSKKYQQKSFFHGLAAVDCPKALAKMAALSLTSMGIQIVKFWIAISAVGLLLKPIELVSMVIGSGFMSSLPIGVVAGPGSAAAMIHDQAIQAASAGLIVTASAIIAGIIIGSIAVPLVVRCSAADKSSAL